MCVGCIGEEHPLAQEDIGKGESCSKRCRSSGCCCRCRCCGSCRCCWTSRHKVGAAGEAAAAVAAEGAALAPVGIAAVCSPWSSRSSSSRSRSSAASILCCLSTSASNAQQQVLVLLRQLYAPLQRCWQQSCAAGGVAASTSAALHDGRARKVPSLKLRGLRALVSLAASQMRLLGSCSSRVPTPAAAGRLSCPGGPPVPVHLAGGPQQSRGTQLSSDGPHSCERPLLSSAAKGTAAS